jgi:hypothetical protein
MTAYGAWGAVGLFLIFAGVNPVIGAIVGLAYVASVGAIHAVGFRDAWSGALLWAWRGSFVGVMASYGVAVGTYLLLTPGFHSSEDYVVYAMVGFLVGGVVGAAGGAFLGLNRTR